MSSIALRAPIRAQAVEQFKATKFEYGDEPIRMEFDDTNRWFATFQSHRIIYFLDDCMLFVDNVGDPSEVRISYSSFLSKKDNPVSRIFEALLTL